MKKRLLVIAAIVTCVSLLAAGTLAYFTDEAIAHNVITSSGVGIEIEEWMEDENGDLVPYPEDPVEGVMPSDKLSKIVTIKNEQASAYVRARYEITIVDANGDEMELTAEELAQVITIANIGESWEAKDPDDGWMYYKEAVAEDAVTEPLFTEVQFSGKDMGNEFQGCTVNVVIYAQGVQVANNGASALEAAGWPAG